MKVEEREEMSVNRCELHGIQQFVELPSEVPSSNRSSSEILRASSEATALQALP